MLRSLARHSSPQQGGQSGVTRAFNAADTAVLNVVVNSGLGPPVSYAASVGLSAASICVLSAGANVAASPQISATLSAQSSPAATAASTCALSRRLTVALI
jgi:hypothetical protein